MEREKQVKGKREENDFQLIFYSEPGILLS